MPTLSATWLRFRRQDLPPSFRSTSFWLNFWSHLVLKRISENKGLDLHQPFQELKHHVTTMDPKAVALLTLCPNTIMVPFLLNITWTQRRLTLFGSRPSRCVSASRASGLDRCQIVSMSGSFGILAPSFDVYDLITRSAENILQGILLVCWFLPSLEKNRFWSLNPGVNLISGESCDLGVRNPFK